MEKGWKEIYMTAHEHKIVIAQGLLEKEGIKSVILNQHDSTYTTFGEYRLYVEEQYINRAIELLNKLKN